MPTTTETQVVGVANEIIGLVGALYSISARISAVSAQWTNISAANLINAFPTAAATTTGGLGTVDVTPVTSHPINTGVGPGLLLVAAISANNVASMLTYLQGINTAIGGGAVTANGAAPQLLAASLAL